MSYVGDPFTHDVFVSYSHGDFQQTGDPRFKRFCQAFASELENELRAHPTIGRTLKVFMDEHQRAAQGLDPMAPLTPQLKQVVADSALLTVLMSPHYLASNWCAQERTWWIQSQIARALPYEDRIAVARIWPTKERWPDGLVDQAGEPLTGFWFHDRKNPDNPHPFGWPAPKEDSPVEFREELLELVRRIWNRLEQSKERLDMLRKRELEQSRLAQSNAVIYLHARTDQREAWERISSELQQAGFGIVPGEPDPIDPNPQRQLSIRSDRVATLSGCDALLLVGTDNGRALDADMVVVGRHDRHSARATSQRTIPGGVLDTFGTPVATPQRKSTAKMLQLDWLEVSTSPCADRVRDWLKEKSAGLGGGV